MVKIIDRGWERIVDQITLMDNSYTKFGFPLGAAKGKASKRALARAEKKGKKLTKYSNISEVAKIAVYQEFGTKRPDWKGQHPGRGKKRGIPARPFMSTSWDENVQKAYTLLDKLYDKVLQEKTNVKQALALVGEWFSDKVKKKIREIDLPPNAPSTIAKKGSSKPLIDTGQMINSVTHVEVIK